MFGSVTIEIAIGLIVVFILVSTICTAIREGIESLLKTRAAYLEQGIRELLGNNATAKSVYEHPLVFGLFKGNYSEKSGMRGGDLPSYIPSKNFALALMDIAAKGVGPNAATAAAPVVNLANIRANVANIGNPDIQKVILNAVDMAQGDLNKAQANIENWYNSGMDRVSGWYKRSTQYIIFIIAMFVVVGMNIDSIAIVRYLSNNEDARKLVLEKAEKLNKDAVAGQETLTYTAAKKELEELKLPIGWDGKDLCTIEITFTMFLGWLITALAAMLGAPYWFDMLNRVMVIRSTVKPHEKSLEEASQDPQPKSPTVVYAAQGGAPGNPPGNGGDTHNHNDDIDGCELPFNSITADEDLPEAKGGVA